MDLADLKTRIDRARPQADAPIPPEGMPILPVSAYLQEPDFVELWRAVYAIRREHPSVFVLFAETVLADLILDELASRDDVPSLQELADGLRKLAVAEGPWLVSTPLANIRLREPVIGLADDVVLRKAELGTEWMDDRFAGSGDISEFEVHRLLGDRISRPTRWLQQPDGARVDTRRGAALLSVEEGTIGLSLPRARAKAQYALAVWATLSPPADRELLPDLGSWVPQPHLQWRQRYKRREEGAWASREMVRGGAIFQWDDYPAPEADTLCVPFEAIEARENRCAQALLSASLALFQASRASRYQLSEQVRNIQVAVETLCEPRLSEWGADERWRHVADHFDVWSELSKLGYELADVDTFQERLNIARNVATHSADAVLLDMDYPSRVLRPVRGGRAFAHGEDLAFSALSADLSPMRFAVRYVLKELFSEVRASGWDDSTFESFFV